MRVCLSVRPSVRRCFLRVRNLWQSAMFFLFSSLFFFLFLSFSFFPFSPCFPLLLFPLPAFPAYNRQPVPTIPDSKIPHFVVPWYCLCGLQVSAQASRLCVLDFTVSLHRWAMSPDSWAKHLGPKARPLGSSATPPDSLATPPGSSQASKPILQVPRWDL